eukprot:GFUD01139350.1.p1 GENE.GFUD01139350.1~~GFUD01139350.1.p1  ORF type:complete len:496 (-),score=133.82 GFUD01139350.1:192-1679(-)
MVEQVEYQESQIAQFYDEKSVFITGATGFMGKVLVEKLLRSTNVKKLYLLIRPKRGVQTKVRIQELMSSNIFDKLKESSPDVVSRVEAIEGDITAPNFGINADDERKLIDEVNVVFHSAATVRFDEALTKAVNLNVVAVFTIMEICKKMKNLQALVQVSTAYCNPQLKHINEEIYSVNGDPQGIIDMCKRMDESLLNSPKITKQIIGNKPNTYTFTKALGESALVLAGGSLPIVVVRPSIVVPTWREPLPGWLDNLNGITGNIAAFGKGVMRTCWVKRDKFVDLIPCDIPINLAIAVAWKTATQPSNSIPVYNCTSGSTNPLSWGQLEKTMMSAIRKYPFEGVFRYPSGGFNEYETLNKIAQFTRESVPAYLLDTAAWMVGKQPKMMRIVQKMHKAELASAFFATNDWKWSTENKEKLNMELTSADKKVFNIDMKSLNWSDFFEDYVKGTRQYVLKEDLATVNVARKHSNNMFWIQTFLKASMFIVLAKLFFYLF